MKKIETDFIETDFNFKYTLEGSDSIVTNMRVSIIASSWFQDKRGDKYDEGEEAGYADLIVINMAMANKNKANPWEIIDGISVNVIEFSDVLFSKDGKLDETLARKLWANRPVSFPATLDLTTFAIAKKLVVRPRYRGLGATLALNYDLATRFNFDFLVTQAFPLQYEALATENNPSDYKGYDANAEDLEAAKTRLVNYYIRKCGMTRLKKGQDYLLLLPNLPNKALHNYERRTFQE